MHSYPPAARTLMFVTWGLAAATSVFTVVRQGWPVHEAPTFAVMLVLSAITLLYPVRSAREQSVYSLCNVFVFAGSVLLTHSWTALLCVLMWIPCLPQRARNWRGWQLYAPPLTNAAQMILITSLTTWLLQATNSTRMDGLGAALWVCLAALLYVVTQLTYVNLLTVLCRKQSWQSLDGAGLDSLVSDTLIIFLGAIVAALWLLHPALLLFAAIPLTMGYRVMQGIQLVKMAELDPKTQLYSNRFFEEQLRAEWKRAGSLRMPISLIFADLDYLRNINNTYGHLAGDAAILSIARILESAASKGGIAARFGGEEFVLLLPGTDIHEAAYVAERLREAVEQARIPVGDGQVLSCTMSLGVAAYPDDATAPEELVKAADDAMYVAKASGRNRVCVAGDKVKGARKQSGDASATHASGAPADAPGTSQSPPHTPPAAEAKPKQEHNPLVTLAAALALSGAVAVLAWTFPLLPGNASWWTLGLLAVIAAANELYKVKVLIPDGTQGSLSFTVAISLAAGTVLGMGVAVLINLVSVIVHSVEYRTRNIYRVIINISIAVLSAAGGALPSELLRFYGLFDSPLFGFATVFLGAGLYYTINMGLMALYFGAVRRESPIAIWRHGLAHLTPHFLALALVGAFIGRLYPVTGLYGALTILVLLLLVRRTFQMQLQHMDATLKAVQETRDVLARANRLEKQSLRELTETVSAIIDARDASVYGHSRQVARYAVAIAEELGLVDGDQLDEVRTAALLHDLGKVGIPEAVLHKPGRLTPAEYEVVKQHAAIGERILYEVQSLRPVAIIVGAHHEHWNGQGYPHGRAGEAIPLAARIVAVADTLDSILTDRPYSRARSLDDALAELRRCAGTQFDATAVDAVHRLVERWPRHYFQNPLTGRGIHPISLQEAAVAIQPDA